MSFFKFCEKVSGFVGLDKTLKNIEFIYAQYMAYKTVGQVADAINNRNEPVSLIQASINEEAKRRGITPDEVERIDREAFHQRLQIVLDSTKVT